MSITDTIIPITTLKANAAEIVREIDAQPLIITQNGSPKAVLMSISEYEETQETLAMLKIIALGKKQIEEGKTHPVKEAFMLARQAAKNGL